MEQNDEKIIIEDKKGKRVLLIGISCIITIFVLFIVMAVLTLGYSKIYDGISINGIKVGGLTENEAIRVLEKAYTELDDLDITLYNGVETERFLGKSINATFDSEKASKMAYNLGREGNFFKKIFSGLKYRFSRQNVLFDVTVDAKKLDKKTSGVLTDLQSEVIQPSYIRKGNQLIIKNGVSGVKIDHTAVRKSVIEELNKLENPLVEVKTIIASPEKVDIEKIQKAIKTNVQNAEYISDTGVLIDQIIGIEIENLEEAKKIAESTTEEGMQFSIPLKITLPETTMENVLEDLFRDTLSTYTTTFNVNEKERTENVKLAANTINNVILMPGQEFSYNNMLGERTTERGYKIAKVYQAGQVVDGLGGGICQVSSTLYNAVVKADLEVTERKNHSLPVSYVKLGTDATVSYGVIDFKFKNNQQYPIRIESKVSGGSLTIDICGINTNKNRSVNIETEFISNIPFTETIIEDPTLAFGTEQVVQAGKKGYKVKSYRVTRENGVEIDRKFIATDTYSPVAQIKKVSAQVQEQF